MKAVAIGTWVLALAAMGFGLYEARESASAGAAMRAGEARRDELRLRVRAREAADAAARRQQADLASVLTTQKAQAEAVASSNRLTDTQRREAYFKAHPEAREKYLTSFRASLPVKWDLLVQYLQLGPQQAAQLMDLLEQRQENSLAVAAEELAKGLNEDSPEIQALDDQLDSANKAQLKALLGSQDYKTFHEFLHDQEVLPVVGDLAQNLAGGGAPLSPDTAVALTRVLAQSSSATSTGLVIENTIDWTKANVGAVQVLTPAQYAAYQLVSQQAETAAQVKQMEKAIAPGG